MAETDAGSSDSYHSAQVDSRALAKLESSIPQSLTNDISWLEAREKEFFKEQDNQYLPIRQKIMVELEQVANKLSELMRVNGERDELAKLKEHEFYLDLDEQRH